MIQMSKKGECIKFKNYEIKIKLLIYADFKGILRYCTDFIKKAF